MSDENTKPIQNFKFVALLNGFLIIAAIFGTLYFATRNVENAVKPKNIYEFMVLDRVGEKISCPDLLKTELLQNKKTIFAYESVSNYSFQQCRADIDKQRAKYCTDFVNSFGVILKRDEIVDRIECKREIDGYFAKNPNRDIPYSIIDNKFLDLGDRLKTQILGKNIKDLKLYYEERNNNWVVEIFNIRNERFKITFMSEAGAKNGFENLYNFINRD